jgi:ketosteroid isomerase-like protein
MMSATETVQRLYDAFASGDGATMAALLGDTHWVEAAGGPYGGTYRGFAEVAANVFGPIGEQVRGFTAKPDSLLPIGDDRVLSLGRYRGTTDAGPLDTRFAHLFTVDGDKISHVEQFTDTHEWRQAVGA